MSLTRAQQAILDYLKVNKKLSDEAIAIILDPSKPLPNEFKFGLFASGDDGVKRARFLWLKWNHLNSIEYKFEGDIQLARAKEFLKVVNSTLEPPFGLGSSSDLRGKVIEALCEDFGIKEADARAEQRSRFVPNAYGVLVDLKICRSDLLNKKLNPKPVLENKAPGVELQLR